jgi:hypothetical protein
VGCTDPRTQTSYAPSAVERPQPVDFFYGRLVDVHRASLDYPYEAGLGLGAGISPYLAGLHLTGGPGPYGGLKITAAFVDIIPSGSAPNMEANEYTVMLNTGTSPPDPFLSQRDPRAAVIVLQNELPDRYPRDVGMQAGENVVVRVVGSTGRVMRDPFAPPPPGTADNSPGARHNLILAHNRPGTADDLTVVADPIISMRAQAGDYPPGAGIPGGGDDWREDARRHLAAQAPMPIPLSGPPVYTAAPVYTGSARSWTVHTFGY